MNTETEIGLNRTGVATSPDLTAEMLEGTTEFLPNAAGDGEEIARLREEYVKDAEPLGSVPPPATLKGAVKTAAKGMLGKHPSLFVDKLSERLAFERTGVRLYQALITKFDSHGGFDGGPTRDDLERIMMDEYNHFQLLMAAIQKLGADPTVQTPSADVQATIGSGPLQVIVDARTNLAQSLEAILVAELADNACWEALVQLARKNGDDELAGQFESAFATEEEHLVRVRSWVAAAQHREQLAAE